MISLARGGPDTDFKAGNQTLVCVDHTVPASSSSCGNSTEERGQVPLMGFTEAGCTSPVVRIFEASMVSPYHNAAFAVAHEARAKARAATSNDVRD